MNARTEQQKLIVALAAEEYGKGKGADNSTTGALILYIQDLEAANREIEVLTTERDNALLRIEELETRVTEPEEMPDSEVGRAIVADWNDARGGVNPNA